MKPTLLDRSNFLNQSFQVSKHRFPHFLKVWHYHQELELVYVTQSEGTRFVGDSIQPFESGDLVLLGANLPHLWQNNESYFSGDSDLMAEAYVVHFNSQFMKTDFGELPELSHIQTLIKAARLGLSFSGKLALEIGSQLRSLFQMDGFEKMVAFLRLLDQLAKSGSGVNLASPGYVQGFSEGGDKRLNEVYHYVMHHFRQEVTVEKAADLASMNKSAFCRYFKKATRKTFTVFLNEVRVGYACKLLLEKKSSVLEVGYQSGYNNISNFNRQFKKFTGMSPTEYRQKRLGD